MFFNNFDFLSPNITLYYKSRKRHLSPIGGILTIVLFSFTIYLIIKVIILKSFPNESSLILYRNFDIDNTNNYFDESGLFHFLYIYNKENIYTANEIQLNNNKKSIIRIYMTYTYDKYDYNSSNLKDNDHWVYDTCHNYVLEEDVQYDYSFSSCIKYYYNSIDKKYYSINDNANFKWPYIKENVTNFQKNGIFATFVEKCTNNSALNEIFGECYPEERINQYLSYFNNIFISFVNNKIEVKNKENKIKNYSQKLYDYILDNKNYFYAHELKLCPFNYEEHRIIGNEAYKSFMFEGEKTSKKIKINENKQLLLVYFFDFRKYINEFRKHDPFSLEYFNKLGGAILLMYYIFYIANYFVNERIEVRNFQQFLNDGGNIIHRHINYEKHKIYTLKSNMFTNILNEENDQYNSFKSTYMANIQKNDNSNIHTSNNNTRPIDKSYSVNIDKIKNDLKDPKKADNVIVINNGTFKNESNHSSNHKLNKNDDKIDKIKSLKVINRANDLEAPEKYNKALTYKKTIEKHSDKRLPSFGINKNDSNTIFNFYAKNKNKIIDEKNDISENFSRQKIIDTSSISLLNFINKPKNLYINNSNYNLIPKKDISMNNYNYNHDKTSESYSPKNLNYNGVQKKIKSLSKENYSQKDFNYSVNIQEEKIKYSFSKKNKNSKDKDKEKEKEKQNIQIQTNIENNKKRRKSLQATNKLRRKKNHNDNENESYKHRSYIIKKNVKNKLNQKPSDKYKERHLSLFTRNSNMFDISEIGNESKNVYIYQGDNNSQINLSKNLVDHYKRTAPLHKLMGKKIDKDMISQNSKILKKSENSIKESKFVKIVQNIDLTQKMFWKYLCLCRDTNNNINILNKFRHKLLSEEYLYILHLNMFMFKQKFGCKSILEKINLLEELYNDF